MKQGSILDSISDFLPDPWPNDLLCLFPAAVVLIAGGGSKDKFGWTSVAEIEPKTQIWPSQSQKDCKETRGIVQIYCLHLPDLFHQYIPALPSTASSSCSGQDKSRPHLCPSSPSLGTLLLLMPLHLLLHTSNLENNQDFDISQVSGLASGSTGHILGEFGSCTQKLFVGKTRSGQIRKGMSLMSGGVMLTLPEYFWVLKFRWVITILRRSCKDGRDLGTEKLWSLLPWRYSKAVWTQS